MKIFNLDTNFASDHKALKFINQQQQQNHKIAKIVQAILKNIQKHQDVAL